MSGTIQKNDIITPEALKVFSEIVAEFQKLLSAAQELKKTLPDSGFDQLDKDAQNAKKSIIQVENETRKFNSLISLGKQQQKENTAQLIAAAKNVAAADKKKTSDQKKNMSDWIAAAKRVATFEKKADRDRRAAAKKKLADQKKDIAEWIAAAKRVAAFEKKAARDKSMADKKEESARKKKTSGLKNLVRSVGIYAAAMFGLNRIVQFFTRDLLNMTKKLDSLDFSMRTIIKDTKEYAATNIFLTKTVINYGQDILTLTERYIKFRAASMQSNMSARETMKIFNSTAKAAAVLGLKTDEVNGVFLALEQMISKGKVTTEELRRQLGERLPGAMGIMADAVGVSIVELDKMLKAGSVLSTEALPKFAVALEKAYGIESLNRVNNLAAAHGRLKTSWVKFVDELQASSVYISVIDEINDQIVKLRWTLGMVNELGGLEGLSDSIGKGANEIVDYFDKIEDVGKSPLADMKNLNAWIAKMKEIGVGMDTASKAFEQYVERRKSLMDADKEGASIKPFSFDVYEKELDKAEKDTKSFANQTSKGLKDSLISTNDFMSKGIVTYEAVLIQQEKELVLKQKNNKKSLDAIKITRDFLLLKKEQKGLSDKEQSNLDAISKNYETFSFKDIAFTEARIEVANRLAETNKKTGKDLFSIEKSQMELRIALKKVELDSLGELGDGGNVAEMKRGIELSKFIKDQNDELAKSANANAKQRIDTQKNAALAQSNVLSESLKRNTLIDKKFFDSSEEDFERFSDQKVASIFADADTQRVAIQKGYTQQILDAKNRASKIKAINIKLAVDLLTIEYNAQQAIIDSSITSVEAKEDAAEKQKQLEEKLQETVRKGTVETEKLKREELEKTFAFISENVNAGFNIQQQFSDNQLQRAKNRYERETQLAGDSEAAKLVAKRKFEAEERKIAKRQAKAAKAQAAFNIGLSTAQAIIGIWAQVPKFDFGISAGILTAVVGGIGAAQLAAVLAKPLPSFAEGVKNFEGGQAIVGDKKGDPTKAGGSELGILPSGQMFLTPSTPTVMNLPSGTDIIPNDGIASVLANEAMNSTYNMIDMSSTNSQLRQINKNTSESTTYEGNYKIVRRKGFVGRYKI